MARKERLLELFTVTCELLNGEMQIPRAAHSESASPPEAPYLSKGVPSLFVTLVESSQRAQRGISEDEHARRALVGELASEGLCRQDALDLADVLRDFLRYGTRSSVRGDRYAKCVLPEVLAKWPPTLTSEQRNAWRERWEPRSERFLTFLGRARELYGYAAQARLLIAAFSTRPKNHEDAYACLLTAQCFGFLGIPRDDVIRPCLACPRFFVATKRSRETCSDACRQRLSRYTRPDRTKALERDRLRKKQKREAQPEQSRPPTKPKPKA